MSSEQVTYEQGAKLTYALVKEWLMKDDHAPRFRFPPKDVALLADLRDVGTKLAINDSAARLVDHLITCVVSATGQGPTTMMLRVVLEMLGQPIEWVPFDQLGLGGKFVPVCKGGQS